ncbi:hypothetical protein GPECTOR_5g80 [Gonium pectorale]|uniref:Uncharacterized protein n=1 Tax=Gonium pectorale TaxID=33097 RepID=A0A150GX18_GONPE|nr:hypothetical protein GPECTOR_5g80 [Gonium pectorale]|eukprot:KXZ54427.1 hypothetical protein GPECTOR_5g80 [Gonium pectorale]
MEIVPAASHAVYGAGHWTAHAAPAHTMPGGGGGGSAGGWDAAPTTRLRPAPATRNDVSAAEAAVAAAARLRLSAFVQARERSPEPPAGSDGRGCGGGGGGGGVGRGGAELLAAATAAAAIAGSGASVVYGDRHAALPPVLPPPPAVQRLSVLRTAVGHSMAETGACDEKFKHDAPAQAAGGGGQAVAGSAELQVVSSDRAVPPAPPAPSTSLPLYCFPGDGNDSIYDSEPSHTTALAAAAAASRWSALDADDDYCTEPSLGCQLEGGAGGSAPPALRAARQTGEHSASPSAPLPAVGGSHLTSSGFGGGGGGGGGAPAPSADSRAVDRYGTLLLSSAGWRCTELYDMRESLHLAGLSGALGSIGTPRTSDSSTPDVLRALITSNASGEGAVASAIAAAAASPAAAPRSSDRTGHSAPLQPFSPFSRLAPSGRGPAPSPSSPVAPRERLSLDLDPRVRFLRVSDPRVAAAGLSAPIVPLSPLSPQSPAANRRCSLEAAAEGGGDVSVGGAAGGGGAEASTRRCGARSAGPRGTHSSSVVRLQYADGTQGDAATAGGGGGGGADDRLEFTMMSSQASVNAALEQERQQQRQRQQLKDAGGGWKTALEGLRKQVTTGAVAAAARSGPPARGGGSGLRGLSTSLRRILSVNRGRDGDGGTGRRSDESPSAAGPAPWGMGGGRLAAGGSVIAAARLPPASPSGGRRSLDNPTVKGPGRGGAVPCQRSAPQGRVPAAALSGGPAPGATECMGGGEAAEAAGAAAFPLDESPAAAMSAAAWGASLAGGAAAAAAAATIGLPRSASASQLRQSGGLGAAPAAAAAALRVAKAPSRLALKSSRRAPQTPPPPPPPPSTAQAPSDPELAYGAAGRSGETPGRGRCTGGEETAAARPPNPGSASTDGVWRCAGDIGNSDGGEEAGFGPSAGRVGCAAPPAGGVGRGAPAVAKSPASQQPAAATEAATAVTTAGSTAGGAASRKCSSASGDGIAGFVDGTTAAAVRERGRGSSGGSGSGSGGGGKRGLRSLLRSLMGRKGGRGQVGAGPADGGVGRTDSAGGPQQL